jgi:hypothetical protein
MNFRKITYVVSAIVMLSPLLYPVLIQVKQLQLKRQARERLEKQSLQKIMLAKNDFHWVEGKKEISINGNLFDVKSFRIENGIYYFTGLFDTKETFIVNRINETWNHDKKTSQVLTELFRMLQGMPDQAMNEILFPARPGSLSFFDPPQPIPDEVSKVWTPPPQPTGLV